MQGYLTSRQSATGYHPLYRKVDVNTWNRGQLAIAWMTTFAYSCFCIQVNIVLIITQLFSICKGCLLFRYMWRMLSHKWRVSSVLFTMLWYQIRVFFNGEYVSYILIQNHVHPLYAIYHNALCCFIKLIYHNFYKGTALTNEAWPNGSYLQGNIFNYFS